MSPCCRQPSNCLCNALASRQRRRLYNFVATMVYVSQGATIQSPGGGLEYF